MVKLSVLLRSSGGLASPDTLNVHSTYEMNGLVATIFPCTATCEMRLLPTYRSEWPSGPLCRAWSGEESTTSGKFLLSRRLAIQRIWNLSTFMDREMSATGCAVEKAYKQAEKRGATTLQEEVEMKVVRQELQGLVALRRGHRACNQSFPFYFMHNHNFGDELNFDLGLALLGSQLRSEVANKTELLERNHGNGSLWITHDKQRRGKIIALGSTIADARVGDVIVGAGAKPFRSARSPECRNGQRGATCAENVTLDMSSIEALKHSSTVIRSVRGPLTCQALNTKHVGVIKRCPSVYGDPGLFAPMLVPAWNNLRWMPARHVQRLPILCVVPHQEDNWLTLAARHMAYYTFCSTTKYNFSVRLVRPRGDTLIFATELRTCDLVAASALHGLVAADALRIPSAWIDYRSHRRRGTERRQDGKTKGYGIPPDAPTSLGKAGGRWKRLPEGVFKYLDYLAGTLGRPIPRLTSLTEAVQLLMQSPQMQPRLTLSQIRHLGKRYLRAFPFKYVCAGRRRASLNPPTL